MLPLPSLIGKQDYDEKDISTLRSEAPQQARLPQAHVYGQRPQRFKRTSPQGTQEVVRELGAPSQRHRALKTAFNSPVLPRGIRQDSPFFMPTVLPLSCLKIEPMIRFSTLASFSFFVVLSVSPRRNGKNRTTNSVFIKTGSSRLSRVPFSSSRVILFCCFGCQICGVGSRNIAKYGPQIRTGVVEVRRGCRGCRFRCSRGPGVIVIINRNRDQRYAQNTQGNCRASTDAASRSAGASGGPFFCRRYPNRTP